MAVKARMTIVALVLALMLPISFSCGSDDVDGTDEAGGGGIASPVKAVDKAQDAADDAEQRAKEIEDEMNQQFEDIP